MADKNIFDTGILFKDLKHDDLTGVSLSLGEACTRNQGTRTSHSRITLLINLVNLMNVILRDANISICEGPHLPHSI